MQACISEKSWHFREDGSRGKDKTWEVMITGLGMRTRKGCATRIGGNQVGKCLTIIHKADGDWLAYEKVTGELARVVGKGKGFPKFKLGFLDFLFFPITW